MGVEGGAGRVALVMAGGAAWPHRLFHKTQSRHRRTSANDASLESALDNRIMDYVTVFELVTVAVYEFPLSQKKLNAASSAGPLPSYSVLYMCRKMVPLVRCHLLGAKRTI